MTDNDKSNDTPSGPSADEGKPTQPPVPGGPTGPASDNAADDDTVALPAGETVALPKYQPEEPKRGSINYQEPGRTAPRKATLAEQRAREVARREAREAEELAYAEAERKRKRRKRILIGTGVTVGVVAVVAVIYASSTPDEVTAQCVDKSGVIVDDDYCDDTYATSHGGYTSGGFIYIGGSSYRYNYGGTGVKGQTISGGSYVAPSSNTSVRTASGKSVSRGGLGVGGSSSGGKSGGS